MGTIINAITINEENTGSMIGNATTAGTQCLKQANVDPNDIELLINIGVYRDDNIMEPSIASLIQQRMNLNMDPAKNDISRRTLSFDLTNGACGFLNAISAANASLINNPSQRILIVGGDAHPSGNLEADFPFTAIGSATLLTFKPDSSSGFGKVYSYSPKKSTDLGYYVFGPVEEFGTEGRSFMPVTFNPDYQDKFCEFGAECINRYLEESNQKPSDFAGFITSQMSTGFPARLALEAGLPKDIKIYDAFDTVGNPHTSATAMGLKYMLDSLEPGQKVLIFEIGSGLATTCSAYEV